jgi:hypothetical protein
MGKPLYVYVTTLRTAGGFASKREACPCAQNSEGLPGASGPSKRKEDPKERKEDVLLHPHIAARYSSKHVDTAKPMTVNAIETHAPNDRRDRRPGRQHASLSGRRVSGLCRAVSTSPTSRREGTAERERRFGWRGLNGLSENSSFICVRSGTGSVKSVQRHRSPPGFFSENTTLVSASERNILTG